MRRLKTEKTEKVEVRTLVDGLYDQQVADATFDLRKSLEETETLSLVEHLVTKGKGSGLPHSFYEQNRYVLDELGRRWYADDNQVLLMCAVCELEECDEREICEMYGCMHVTFRKLGTGLKNLRHRRYLSRRCRYDSISYRLSPKIERALFNGELKEGYKIERGEDFLQEIQPTFEVFLDDELEWEDLYEDLSDLMAENSDLDMLKYIQSLNLSKIDLIIMFHCMIYLILHNRKDVKGDFFGRFGDGIASKIAKDMNDGKSDLMQKNILELATTDGMANCSVFSLTEDFVNATFPDFELREPTVRELHNSNDIAEVDMFYNAAEEKQVERLHQLLQPENFKSVLDRLKARHMRGGFTCIFYGGPGTGKTETVLQLARQTGRNLYEVNVSQIIDKFVGESEKNIKEVFRRYARLVKQSSLAPILFFNEADALISTRSNVSKSANASVQQMWNSIQNIILEEMERLNGIMIATTNLTENMDSAFERRFLYKIKFNAPSVEAKSKIWQAKLPEICGEDAKYLAERYDFSGGQIENVVRKVNVAMILSGEDISLKNIEEACKEERLEGKKPRAKVGF